MRTGKFILALWLLVNVAHGAPSHPREISKAALEKKVVERAKESLPKGTRVEVETLHVDRPIPEGYVLHDLRPVPPLGALNFQFLAPSMKEKPIAGNAVVRAYAPIAVSKTSISHNDDFSEGNVGFEMRELTPYSQRGYFPDLASLQPLKAKGFIRPGTVIVAMNTQAPAAVNYGQTIDLIHQQGTLSVSARVRALENGKIGDWIRAENPTSRKTMRVRVTGVGEAQTR